MRTPRRITILPKFMFCIWLLDSLVAVVPAADSASARLNIVFITADDMNHDSAGCYDCPIKDLTPNLDRLATEGIRFQYAYSTVAVCQPVGEEFANTPQYIRSAPFTVK